MMNRNEEAHAACLNILSDNKDSAPRIAELCTLSRLLGSELDTITAERDRLAAENAELRKQVEDWKTGSTHEAHYGDDARRDLAAANATLDKLRDLLPEGGVWCYACNRATVPVWGEEPYEHIDPKYNQMKTTFRCSICKRDTHAKDSCVDTLRAILHPQPENES